MNELERLLVFSTFSPFSWYKAMGNQIQFSASQNIFLLAKMKTSSDIMHRAMKRLHKSLEMWNVLIPELIFSKVRIPEKGKIAFKWQVIFSPALKPAGLNMRVQRKGSQQSSSENVILLIWKETLFNSSTTLSLVSQSSPTLTPFSSVLQKGLSQQSSEYLSQKT